MIAVHRIPEWETEQNGMLFTGGTETMIDTSKIRFQRLYYGLYQEPAADFQSTTRIPVGATTLT